MMKEQIQAFIFDLDGVITDTAEYHYLAWKAIADELGIEFTRAFNENLKGVSRMDSLKLLLSQAKDRREYTAQEMEELADRKNKLYQTMIEKVTPSDILPGINELLSEIKRRGIKLGLASASKNAFFVMERLGLKSEFGAIVDSSKIANNKPDPEVFLKAAEMLQVDPAYCIGVEDAVSGVQAIKSAGMFAVAIGDREAFPHADLVLERTSQLDLAQIATAFASAANGN